MADVAIFAALKALGDALANEVVKLATSQTSELLSLFSELECNMKTVRSELQVIQVFLDEINTQDRNNRVLETWLVEARNLAYHIQDITDEFVYLSNNKENGGVRFYVKRLFQNPPLLPFKQIASQLKDAEKNLRNLSEMRNRWVSNSSAGLDRSTHYSIECSQHGAISAHFIDEVDVVGVEKNRALLMSWLNFTESNLSVISVWGMGGLGKTTLVTNIFKRERNNFECYAWISISQSYTVDQILRNLISEIYESEKRVPLNTTTMDIRKLKETLTEALKEKRYLIVLDDVWDPLAFCNIQDVLINCLKGSRIVITSRNEDVASLAPKEHRLQLWPLTYGNSWELFCKKAFQFEANHECPVDMQHCAREIVLKCEGLPLALVSIGGLLSLREKSVVEWKRVHNQLNWELENNPSFDHLRNILKLSFNYLSRNLKNCFLYCCMFPEDHLLARKKLSRLWIAEGFIEERGTSTLEEVAEGYLTELIRRSMLQLVRKNYVGRVKRCRMHDILRELAISVCMKENFGLMHEDNKIVKVNTTARRLSVIKLSNENMFNVNLPQLRTFLSFDPVSISSLLSSILLNSRYLAVLDLESLPIKMLPETIGKLFNLRYLGLRETMVEFLPKSIGELHNLQTLDLYNSKIRKLPNGIIELKKLRHFFAQIAHDKTYLSFRSISGICLPKGITELKDLQSLQTLEANVEVIKELGNCTQLRKLRLCNVKESYSADLCRALSRMPLLSYLDVYVSGENEFLQLECLNPQPPQLQTLCLSGQLKETIFESPLFQNSRENLQKLYFAWSLLRNDPLPSLSHLSKLTILALNKAYDGQLLVFRDGWFPKLKYLSLKQLPSLIQVEMEEGTMISLEDIYFQNMKQLVQIPNGIENLTSLKRWYCDGLSHDFVDLVKEHQIRWHFKCYIKAWEDDD